jgi:hypothetical protein
LNKARQALLKEEVCEVVKLQGSTVALMLLSNESDAVKKTVEYELKRHDGNLTDAHSAILQIPLQSEKLEQFVEDGKQLIFWMQQNQAFGRYDSVQKVILASRLFPDPTNDSYTTNKYFWGATGEFPMYFPKEAPEERSGRFRKDKSNFQALSVYPNPCENYIRVNAAMAQDEVAVFELLDIMGRVVFSSNFNSHGHDPLLVLPDLVEGSYLYRIRCFDQVFTGKIQVK